MKSAHDQREKRIVRKIKFTNIEAFYDSADTTTNSFRDFNYVKHRFTEQSGYSSTVSYRMLIVWGFVEVFDAIAI